MLAADHMTVVREGRPVVDDVSLTIAPGQVVALVGPNGAGKSTLLNALSGSTRADHGRVTLDGKPIDTIDARRLASRRAVVEQSTHLDFPFTVLEIVMLGVTVPGFKLDESLGLDAAIAALEAVGMAELRDRKFNCLSGGERQRALIARGICQLTIASYKATGALAFLLDEPTSSLDLAHQTIVVRELRRQAAMGRAVLVVLHDLNLAAEAADDIVVLSRGKVAASGPPAKVLDPALLSQIYGCQVTSVMIPGRSSPVVMPAFTRSRIDIAAE